MPDPTEVFVVVVTDNGVLGELQVYSSSDKAKAALKSIADKHKTEFGGDGRTWETDDESEFADDGEVFYVTWYSKKIDP
ncbi:MAG: hypothetical protein ACYCOU_00515 [Sulfobacillus sp.]